MKHFLKLFSAFLVICFITACGGGSGGSGGGNNDTPALPASPVKITLADGASNVLEPGDTLEITVSLNPTTTSSKDSLSVQALTATTDIPVALSLNGADSNSYSFSESSFTLTTTNPTKVVELTIAASATPADFTNPQLVANVAGYETSAAITLDIVSSTDPSLTFSGSNIQGNSLILGQSQRTTVALTAKGLADGTSRTVTITPKAGIQVSPSSCTLSKSLDSCDVEVIAVANVGTFPITATAQVGVTPVSTFLNVTVVVPNSITFSPDSVAILTQGSGSLDTTTVTLHAESLPRATTVTIKNDNPALQLLNGTVSTNTIICDLPAGTSDDACTINIASISSESGEYKIQATAPNYTISELSVRVDKPGTFVFAPKGLKLFAGESYPATLQFNKGTSSTFTIPVNFSKTGGVDVNPNECTITQDTPSCNVTISATAPGAAQVSASEPGGAIIQNLEVFVNSFSSVTSGNDSATPAQTNTICALDVSGNAYCWGYGRFGQIGNRADKDVSIPNPVVMPLGVTFKSIQVKTQSVCALGDDGNIYCWGDGDFGQLGNGGTQDANVPTKVTLPSNVTGFKSFTVGVFNACATANTGVLYCWGSNYNSLIGNSAYVSTNEVLTPTPVTMPAGVTELSNVVINGFSYIGDSTACAIGKTGESNNIYCWGMNDSGQLGNGTTNRSYIPFPITKPSGVSSFSSLVGGQSESAGLTSRDETNATECAIANTDEVYCWGNNYSGEVGIGSSTAIILTPQLVQGPKNVNSLVIASGNDDGATVCTKNTQGALYCWGAGKYGQIGNGFNNNQNTPQVNLANVTTLTAGNSQVCATINGTLSCWGLGTSGQLGNSYSLSQNTPSAVIGGASFSNVTIGNNNTCAIGTFGNIYCWGDGKTGQIGNGGNDSVNVPTMTIPAAIEINNIATLLTEYVQRP